MCWNRTIVNNDFYRRKCDQWKKTEFRKIGGRRNPPKECIQKNGIPFVSLVLETHKGDKITYKDVADYLDIRLKHLPKIEQLIRGES